MCFFFVPCSWVNAKGQQFVGVHVVERAQVRQPQEEFGEEGGVVWATSSDERPQSPNQTLLELLHSSRVRDATAV